MRRLLCFGTVLSALVAVVLAAPAHAEDTVTSEQLALEVYLAADPAAAIASLDQDEVAILAERVSGWTAVEVQSEADQAPPHGPGEVRPRRRCRWRNLLVPLEVLQVVRPRREHRGDLDAGQLVRQQQRHHVVLPHQSGWRGLLGVNYQGLGAYSANNVGWEVRQAQVFKFSIAWASANPCMQIRGGKTGLTSFRANCNLS